jgi:DNA-binding PadR family transcriptional regulator
MMKTAFGRHFGHHDHDHDHDHDTPGAHVLRHFMRGFDRRFGRDFNRGFGGAGRTRRGDVKYLVLEVLAEGARHGYEIMTAIEERRGFRPSPGSIYPTLQMLEDGGFVTSAEVEGKRVYTITDMGRALLSNRSADADEGDEEPDARHRLRHAAMKLASAVMGVRGSDDATLDRVREIIDRARKEIYAILASDEV